MLMLNYMDTNVLTCHRHGLYTSACNAAHYSICQRTIIMLNINELLIYFIFATRIHVKLRLCMANLIPAPNGGVSTRCWYGIGHPLPNV